MSDSPPAIEDLLKRLQARVADKRTKGEYPEDLEDKLDAHFRRIVFHRVDHDSSKLNHDLEAVETTASFDPKKLPTDSSAPGGELLHRAVKKAMSRQSQGIMEQMQRFSDAVLNLQKSLVAAVQTGSSHVHPDLIGHIDAVLERLDSYERAPADSAAAVGDLRKRVEELERAEANRQFNPWFTNDAFEDAFRGSATELNDRYKDLVSRFSDVGALPVVDIGCGRGEFMELLIEQGNTALGVEIDPALAEIAQTKGLKVEVGDGVKLLSSMADNSLGGVVLVQVVEHLSRQQQVDLVATAYRKLAKGGHIVMETVNPQSLYVFAHAFYIDPTHTQPVHPAYLMFLLNEIGFSEVGCDWRTPPPSEDQLEPDGKDQKSVHNKNVARLNNLLFASSDYAAFATK